jgi:hypothetical protein
MLIRLLVRLVIDTMYYTSGMKCYFEFVCNNSARTLLLKETKYDRFIPFIYIREHYNFELSAIIKILAG